MLRRRPVPPQLSARRLEERAEPHARRARGLAGAAAETEIQMAPEGLAELHAPLRGGAHQVDAAARGIHLLTEDAIGRARRQADPAMHALPDLFDVGGIRSAEGRGHHRPPTNRPGFSTRLGSRSSLNARSASLRNASGTGRICAPSALASAASRSPPSTTASSTLPIDTATADDVGPGKTASSTCSPRYSSRFGWSDESTTRSTNACAASAEGSRTSHERSASGSGCRRSVSSPSTPSVPSAPIITFGTSYPLTDFTTFEPPQVNTPSAWTKRTPSSRSRIVP